MSEAATTSLVKRYGAVRVFIGYRIVSRLYFHLLVLYIFLLVSGQGVVAVAVAIAAYGFALTLATPLSSRMLSAWGPMPLLVGGEALKGLGLALLAMGGGTLPLAITGQVVNAAGFSMASTADPPVAMRVVDGDSAAFGRLQSATQSYMFLAVLVSGVAGGLMFVVDPVLPVVAGALAALAGAVVAVVLARQVGRKPLPEGGATGGAATTAVRPVAEEGLWIGYYVLTRGFMLGAFVGLVPYLLYRVVQVDVVGLVLCLAGFSLAAFVSARYINAVITRIGAARLALSTVVILVTSFLLFAFTTSLWVSIVAMLLMGLASGGVRPATMSRLASSAAEHRDGRVPLGLISRMESVFGLCNAMVVLAGGILIATTNFTTAMIVASATYLLAYVVVTAVVRARSGSSERDPLPSP